MERVMELRNHSKYLSNLLLSNMETMQDLVEIIEFFCTASNNPYAANYARTLLETQETRLEKLAEIMLAEVKRNPDHAFGDDI